MAKPSCESSSTKNTAAEMSARVYRQFPVKDTGLEWFILVTWCPCHCIFSGKDDPVI